VIVGSLVQHPETPALVRSPYKLHDSGVADGDGCGEGRGCGLTGDGCGRGTVGISSGRGGPQTTGTFLRGSTIALIENPPACTPVSVRFVTKVSPFTCEGSISIVCISPPAMLTIAGLLFDN
jgi:hypothetical protein